MEEIENLEQVDINDNSPKENEFKKPGIKQVSILYTISILLFTFIGTRVQKSEFFSGILITEYILILLPPLIFLLIYRYDFRKVLRLNRIGILNALLVFLMMIFSPMVISVVNLVNLLLVKFLFGKVVVSQPPMLPGKVGFLINIFLIAVTAGICEEVMYRGVVQRGFERLGATKAILLTAFLFSLAHMDFQKLLGIIVLGSLIGFIVYRTNSIFAGMLAHFTNNAFALLMTYLFDKIREASKVTGINPEQDIDKYFSTFANMPKTEIIVTIISFAIFVLMFASVLAGLLIIFIYNTRGKQEKNIVRELNPRYKHLLWLTPGVLMVGLVYFVEGLKLRGINMAVVEMILKIIGYK